MAQFSRRGFLQVGTGTALASVMPGRHFTLAAQEPSASTTTPQVERVRFASIGVGIQGSNLLRAAVTLQGAQCVAACDLYDGRGMGQPGMTFTRISPTSSVPCGLASRRWRM